MAEERDNGSVPEIISDHVRIIAMMQRLYRGRAALTVTLPGGKIRSKSVILEINPKTGRFLINNFHSEPAHQRFLESKKFYAYSQLDGIEIRFSAELINVLSEGEDFYYLITIPKKIDYHQRRAFHRVSVNREVIPVHLTLQGGISIEGQMDDISAEGISILFAADLPALLEIGAQILQCMFKIPGGDLVACELKVRFINHGHDTSLPKIGAQIINVDKTLQKTIQHFVLSLERQQLKENTVV